ncbi:hypothetical protein V8E51_002597 [Hyaloscypha variabilis]
MPSFTTISALLLAIIGTTSADIFTATASLPGSNLDGLPSTLLVDSFGLEAPLQATAQLWFLTVRLSPRPSLLMTSVAWPLRFPAARKSTFFNLTIISDCTAPRTVINWKGADGSTGVFACPTIPASGNTPASYQVFLKTPAFNLTNCVTLGGFTATYLPDFTIGAWQYM